MHLSNVLTSATLCLLVLCGAAAGGDDCGWPEIDAEHRPGAYWHWMASAVDEANLTRELETFHAAGLGGVHIIPIYGAKGYEDRYVEYLSPRWMALLAHTVREAKRLGMWVDMSTGTGWNFGGPNIPDDMANAIVEMKLDKGLSGKPWSLDPDKKGVRAVQAFDGHGQSADLLPALTPQGTLEWTPPEGAWSIISVWQKPSGTVVERAAPGGEGWMLNIFQGGVMQHYLERFDAAFAAYDGAMPRAMYHDSYEYKCNWAQDLFAAFEKRRGYRLQDRLDVFFGDARSDDQARIKCDYRETLDDMILENGIQTWVNWAHRCGCITRNQAHGSPGNLLDLYAAADIPETEMFNKDRNPLVSKLASSAAHVMGKLRVAAETGTWLREHFHVTLGDLKVLIDDLFVSGVNQVLYHGTCYSPADAPWPGWLFYASTQMNPRNAIWHDVPVLNTYIARCQSLLQTSRPDNDILLYWPIHDVWHNPDGMETGLSIHRRAWFEEHPFGRAAQRLWEKGYAFDYLSDRQLANIEAGPDGLAAPGGKYRVLLIPQCTHIPLATMERFRALAATGGTLLFEKHVPQDVPGLHALEERRTALSRLTQDFSGAGEHAVGKGRVIVGEDLENLLERVGVARETLADRSGLQHLRRKHEAGRLYFLANRGQKDIAEYVPLATSAQGAVLLDPMTGRAGVAALRPEGARTSVFLRLAPGQSVFVRTFTGRNAEGPPWPYRKPAGGPMAVNGRWRVEFIEGGPALPPASELTKLVSWTDFPNNPDTKSFAGTAHYMLDFALPRGKAPQAWRLDLGAVAETARVRVNGLEAASLILPPFSVDLAADLLKPEGNLLEVEVTNLSANRIRDLDRRGVQWRIFNDINFVNIDYKPFDASGWPLRPSGLLGPVSLTPLEEMPR